MSTTKESGFEGPLPLSIKPDGFHCHQRGGCDRGALCESEGECLGVEPPLENGANRHGPDEIVDIDYLDVGLPPANASRRNLFDDIAEIVRALTYAEMVEFAGGLWSLRGGGEVNVRTLPRILHAWATKRVSASDWAIHNEPALPAGDRDGGAGRKFQPIDTAPKDRPILAFMLGQWRVAQWKANHRKRPMPFWSANDLRATVSRAHQPTWWAELPPPPPQEIEA